LQPSNKTEYDSGEKTGAWFSYVTAKNEKIRIKVGISYISCQKAKVNLEAEIPGWDLSKVTAKTVAAWNTMLNKVEITGASDEQKHIFLYRIVPYHAHAGP